MSSGYDLSRLGPYAFEHLVNLLTHRVLGAGSTGFGPGPDGGRDGYLVGEAPYPTPNERWRGTWHIQSKFFAPHLTKDPHRWICSEIKKELEAYSKAGSRRSWPDNLIVATNVDPSGHPKTGAFDRAHKLARKAAGARSLNFDIWGGGKILDWLAQFPDLAAHYAHFLTPGHVLSRMFNDLGDAKANSKAIIRHYVVRCFKENQFTKLDQAGSSSDTRPGIHDVFIDLPYRVPDSDEGGNITVALAKSSDRCHRPSEHVKYERQWRDWNRRCDRARVWMLKAGPGQGKSTIAQFFSQVQRAALILEDEKLAVAPEIKHLAQLVKNVAEGNGFWPAVPRIPIAIELRDYAKWLGDRSEMQPRGILTYLASMAAIAVEQDVQVGTLKRMLSQRSWFAVFDGLDEVPNDMKDPVAAEVRRFLDDLSAELDIDLFGLCTSRPQGYSGQFADIDGPSAVLTGLSPETAILCATPVLKLNRTAEEFKRSMDVLKAAMSASSVKELMATPLQSHIMAVVVRDGGRPPERRWQLFSNFYQVMRKRETLKEFPNPRIAKILREEERLLKAIHSRLGFVLHAHCETSSGAQSRLSREEFKALAVQTVSAFSDDDVPSTVETLMEATTERLVLVNTPESGDHVSFDIRQLQEFFAAEFIYEGVEATQLGFRLDLLAGDAHWREVIYFVLSALVENGRATELPIAIAVLDRLDNPEEGGPSRLFHRRMARGALFAARLLQEGVLEQDRRMREQFRSVLEPIVGLIEAEPLQSLADCRPRQSRVWLTTFLVEAFFKFDFAESVGACVALALMLDGDDVRSNSLMDRFVTAPISYQSMVVKTVGEVLSRRSDRKSPMKEPAKWFLDAIAKRLLLPSWMELDVNAIRTGLSMLATSRAQLPQLSAIRALPLSHGRIFELIAMDDEPAVMSGVSVDLGNNYGLLQLHHFKRDWTTGTIPIDITKDEIEDVILTSTGLLRLVMLMLRFAMTRQHEHLMEVGEALRGHEQVLFALPSELVACIPVHLWGRKSIAAQFNDVTASSAVDWIARARQIREGKGKDGLTRPYDVYFRAEKCSITQWRSFTRDIPQIASYYWFEDWIAGSNRSAAIDSAAGVQALLEALERTMDEVPSFILAWGRLVSAVPDREEYVRGMMVRASKDTKGEVATMNARAVYPYKLRIDAERDVLIPLAAALVFTPVWGRRTRDASTSRKLDLLDQFGLTVPSLSALAGDGGVPVRTRAAALALALLGLGHDLESGPQVLAFLRSHKELILELDLVVSDSWYVGALKISLSSYPASNSPDVVEIVGVLLENARGDFERQSTLQSIIAKLRERSSEMTSQTPILQSWLE